MKSIIFELIKAIINTLRYTHNMSHKNTAFYRGTKQVNFDFSAEKISSDGAVLLLEKLERNHKVISYFSNIIPDTRNSSRITHNVSKLLKQRVYGIMLGYEDANDVKYLKNDPLLQDILEGDLASQPTILLLGEIGLNMEMFQIISLHHGIYYLLFVKQLMLNLRPTLMELVFFQNY